MAKYAALKQERDDAVERAVIAERNSQLERVRELESLHAAEMAELQDQVKRLEMALADTKRSFVSAVDDATRLLFRSVGRRDDGRPEVTEDNTVPTHDDRRGADA